MEQSRMPKSWHTGTYGPRSETLPQVASGLEAAILSSMPQWLEPFTMRKNPLSPQYGFHELAIFQYFTPYSTPQPTIFTA